MRDFCADQRICMAGRTLAVQQDQLEREGRQVCHEAMHRDQSIDIRLRAAALVLPRRQEVSAEFVGRVIFEANVRPRKLKVPA